MLFNSISYLIFFPLVCAIHWLSPKSFRPWILLIASYLFYMSWLPAYGLLLLALSVSNYLIGLCLGKFRSQSRYILLLGLLINLGALCFYKYSNFLLSGLFAGLNRFVFAVPKPAPLLQIILPLGISFFVFEFIHYLTDVHSGDEPITHPVEFGLFAAFFPSQIAGPIKRYQDFIHQLRLTQPFQPARFEQGLAMLLQGLFKKLALADTLAPIASACFDHVASHGALDTWVAVLSFAGQIYFDFSGYTDMGRGSALMLGFSLPDNFNFPYIASSLSDFWRRWHISLSTWLRDYLYIPLGGSRCGRMRKHFNLLVTMLLGGLWHGAAWHYVVWGGFHGLGLMANHEYDVLVTKVPFLRRFHSLNSGKLISVAATLSFVLIGWIFFRAHSVVEGCRIICNLFTMKSPVEVQTLVSHSPVITALVAYAIYFLLSSVSTRWSQRPIPDWVRSVTTFGLPTRVALYLGAAIASIGFSPMQSEPFIYFQF